MTCIKQINAHKSSASTEQIAKYKADFILAQEPNVGMLNTLRRVGKLFHVSGAQRRRIRSIIYQKNPNYDCTVIPEFSTNDIVTIQLEGQDTVLCSAYLDSKILPAWPAVLTSLSAFCKMRKLKLVIGADCNGHSSFWNSPDTNRRGEDIEIGIIQNDLFVHNQGHKPTFSSHLGESIIDITLSNTQDMVTDWMVSDEISFSDHKIVQFNINGVTEQPETLHRNIKKVNWREVAADLKEAVPAHTPALWSVHELESACDSLTRALRNSLDKHAPLKPRAKRHCIWWNEECTKAKSLCRRLHQRARRKNSAFLLQLAKTAQHDYQNTITKAKKSSWQSFISEVDNVSDMAKINKIMKAAGGSSIELGLIKDAQGKLAENKQESLELLLEDHFPESIPITNEDEEDRNINPKTLPNRSWLTVERFRAAAKAFKPGKTPGWDEFRAELFQVLDDDTVNYLLKLFNASITLGHVPKVWRKVDVIFLAKTGKPDYTERGAFRPISLMSCLFKLLERLSLYWIEESVLSRHPPHDNQFGSRKGRSTINALSQVVDQIEHGIQQGQYVLGVAMDIKGAFNNLAFDSMTKEFEARGVDTDIIAWYRHFLENRTVTAKHGSATASVRPTRGTPQGGVWSSILSWNLPFDNLLKIFDHQGCAVKATAFVDDATLLITGSDPATLYSIMQDYLNRVQKWAEDNGLQFCPRKTTSTLFSHRRRPRKLPKLFINGTHIPDTKTVKLLGITLDSKLTWQPHIDQRIKACKNSIMRLRPLLNHTWSPQPRYTRWLVEGVIYPMLLYGSLVWAKATERKPVQKALYKLQRLCLLSIANVRRGTPTKALEIIYNIAPLHLQIRERARYEFIRLPRSDDEWTTTYPPHMERQGHLQYTRQSLPPMEDDDAMTPIARWDKNYTVTIEPGKPAVLQGISAFTDGSRIDNNSGAGALVKKDNVPILTIMEHLPDVTVFQSELRAIAATCEHLLAQRTTGQHVTFHVDSQAALRALDATYFKSKLANYTAELLQELTGTNKVDLQWIKAHVSLQACRKCGMCGNCGNDAADEAAKWAAAHGSPINYSGLSSPRATTKLHVRELRNRDWSAEWSGTRGCRQSKLFLPKPQPAIWKELKLLKHSALSRAIRFLTGHTFQKRHNTVIKHKVRGPAADFHPEAQCRLCNEGEETPEHLITSCPVLMHTRCGLFLALELPRPPECPEWTKKILEFANTQRVRKLEEDEVTQTGGI